MTFFAGSSFVSGGGPGGGGGRTGGALLLRILFVLLAWKDSSNRRAMAASPLCIGGWGDLIAAAVTNELDGFEVIGDCLATVGKISLRRGCIAAIPGLGGGPDCCMGIEFCCVSNIGGPAVLTRAFEADGVGPRELDWATDPPIPFIAVGGTRRDWGGTAIEAGAPYPFCVAG